MSERKGSDGVSDGERAAGGATDKWRHLRDVLAQRTKAPLVVDQGGATVVGSVRLGIAQAADRARADRDLSAISACWNCADDLVSDLGRERARAERLRAALGELLTCSFSHDETRLLLVGFGGSKAPDSLRARCDRIQRAREAADAALAADAPGDAGRIRRVSDATIDFTEEHDYDKRD